MLKVLALLGLAALASAAPAAEKVDYLPQMGNFTYGVYSGYLPINGTSKSLHYFFLESQSNPSTDPLLVWYSGGPGCSSMLAFAVEHGAYVVLNGEYEFSKNDFSWNKEANIIYIESPAGVGYSTCDQAKGDCTFDDDITADDNLVSILNWFDKFPEFKTNDFYITGESYSGIYVPYTTLAIHKHNEKYANDDSVFKPNLKGFMVGNGVTNWKYDTNPAFVEMAYWHNLYDTQTYNAIKENHCTDE